MQSRTSCVFNLQLEYWERRRRSLKRRGFRLSFAKSRDARTGTLMGTGRTFVKDDLEEDRLSLSSPLPKAFMTP